MNTIFHINHRASAFKNISFWLCLCLPLIIGVVVGAIIWLPLELTMNSKGYKYFLEISALPLGIMSLTFPSVGIYMFQFKSKQASELYLISKKRDIEIKKDKYLDSLIALSVIVSRVSNHLAGLEKSSTSDAIGFEELTVQFNHVQSLWETIFKDPMYVVALSRLYNAFQKADAFFCGASLGISIDKKYHRKKGVYSKLMNELTVIQLKIEKDSSHCKSASLQDIYNTYLLCGLSPKEVECELKDEIKKMDELDNRIRSLESKLSG